KDPSHFHPMKGPMTTQTLRGMVNHGAMHWRGDRVVPTGNGQCTMAGFPFACCTGAGSGNCTIYDADVALQNCRVAFPGLVGRNAQIPGADMQAFSQFILQVYLPPNPNRNLNNSLTTAQNSGQNFFRGINGSTRCADGLNFGCPGGTGDSQVGFACHG